MSAWDGLRARLLGLSDLVTPAVKGLSVYPRTCRPASPSHGARLLGGEWRFGRDLMNLAPTASPFQTASPTRSFANVLHRFDWIADLVSAGQDGRGRALALIDDWVSVFGHWNRFSWMPDRVNDRLWAWLLVGPDLIEEGPPAVRAARLRAIVRQARWLQQSALPIEPMARLCHLRTRCALAAALPGLFDISDAEQAFSSALPQAVDRDGLVVSRCPSAQLELAYDLLSLDELWGRLGRSSIRGLNRTLTAMVTALRFLRYRDGGLPVFQLGSACDERSLSPVFDKLPGARPGYVLLGGYHSADCGSSRLMVDAGPFVPGGSASQLAFEFVDGAQRIVCGAGGAPDLDEALLGAVRRSAAHAGLVLADCDSGPVIEGDARASGSIPFVKRIETPQNIRFELSLETWREAFGLVWSRSLIIDRDGGRLSGDDMLAPPVADRRPPPTHPLAFQIWFPLHPGVRAERDEDQAGASVRVRLTGPAGQVWLFETNAPDVECVASVYCAGASGVVPTQAICVKSRFDPSRPVSMAPNRIHWQFIRHPDGATPTGDPLQTEPIAFSTSQTDDT